MCTYMCVVMYFPECIFFLKSYYAQMVKDKFFFYKIDYDRKILKVLKLKGHKNCMIG